MHLTGTDLFGWITSRRVRSGGVALHGPVHFGQGRTMPCYLPGVFGRLAGAELIGLRDPDFPQGPRRIVLTPRGPDRYEQLAANCHPSPCQNSLPEAVRVPLTGRYPRLRPVRGSVEESR